jgi:SAM-dependent methyltransferase
MSGTGDTVFAGSIPALYEQLLVPMLFEPYARDLSARVAALAPSQLLELACGTGVVTRQLASDLGHETRIVATDLNQAMLDQAAALPTARPVDWRHADAQLLPFADASFDLVCCQFGAMFFPDKPGAFAEARRVLRPGGSLLFNVWDAIAHNAFADVVTQSLAQLFPGDPPRFMARTPHGYHDIAQIARDLAQGGFTATPRIETLAFCSDAASAQLAATAYCQGTPLRGEIEARDPDGLATATAAVAAALAARFGDGPISGRIQAHVVTFTS